MSQSQGWKLWGLPWWVWLIPIVPEIVLLDRARVATAAPTARADGPAAQVALALLALISLANAPLLLAVIASLVRGDDRAAPQLLLKAITVWGTNVITCRPPVLGPSIVAARCAGT